MCAVIWQNYKTSTMLDVFKDLDLELDRQLWTVISCSEHPQDFVQFVRHAANRDAGHLVALNTAVHFRHNRDADSLLGICITILESLAAENSTVAMYHRGRWDTMGFKHKYAAVDDVYWYRMGMELGDGRCTMQLALKTLQTDSAAGMQLLKQAVELGHSPAHVHLARFEPQWYEEHLRIAAGSGDPFSMFCLGRHLVNSASLRDTESGIEWIRRGALAGEGDACLYLGKANLNGNDVFDMDEVAAHEWLALGGQHGNAQCMSVLGSSLLKADEPELVEQGKLWLQRASMLESY
jgi:TPR repeat protein